MRNLKWRKKEFFKNIILNISENNVLRTLKNWKIKEVSEDAFDKKTLENIKNKFFPLIRIVWSFLWKNSMNDFWRDSFFFWRIFEMEKDKKVEIKYKTEEYKHLIYKKIVRKKFYEIKKN